MRPPLALLAIVAVTGASSCGDVHSVSHTTSHASYGPAAAGSTATASPNSTTPAAADARVDGDRDSDIGAPHDDTNNSGALDFGHEASAPDKRTIAALIKRYYAVALFGDGAKACAMLYSTIAESLPEDYGSETGQPPGPPYMRGKTCPAIMTGLFRHFHAQLTVEVPKLRVVRVHLEEHHGVALLNFGALPERTISFAREGHVWKMNEMIDAELP